MRGSVIIEGSCSIWREWKTLGTSFTNADIINDCSGVFELKSQPLETRYVEVIGSLESYWIEG